ncbi:MraY family glycosyltransferase [Gorillibacterium sp. CAU 1737]|uniref:MraY family glycosyltransferase n=1 Tax=Gorillibacterium sp. CAU 1737 TaxID=3140362 RepID=UPI00325FF7B2
MTYAIPLFTALLVVLLLIPPIRALALRTGFVDRPGGRKIHGQPIPLLGGTAIYLGVIVSVLLYAGWTAQTKTILTGGTLMALTGLLDDSCKAKGKDFPVWPRLILYLAAAGIPLLYGIGISSVRGWEGQIAFPQAVIWIGTILWMFAIPNMINFIDGVDGLASGIVSIASAALFLAALWQRQPESAVLAAILFGVSLGFLAYNFYPARIFMGDSGAVFLGYTIAVLAVNGSFKSATVISLAVPVLALGVPIFDTAQVFLRRLLKGKGLHRADNLHTHHLLMRWGLSQTQTVAFLYLVELAFTLLAVILLLLYPSL